MARYPSVSVGARYGRWLVVGPSERGTYNRDFWVCSCSCGNTRKVSGVTLRNGTSESCGCATREAAILNIEKFNHSRRYAGDLTASVTQYKRNAAKRGHAWGLSIEEAAALLVGSCHYCGIPPCSVEKRAPAASGLVLRNGIDRVDNSSGYTLENSVSCCAICNQAKSSLSKSDFLAWVSRIAQYQGFTTYNPPPTQEDDTMKWQVM